MRCIAIALGIISIGLFALFALEQKSSRGHPLAEKTAVERAPAIPVDAESSTHPPTANAASEPKIVATADGFTLSGVRSVLQYPGKWTHNLASPVIPEFPKSFTAPVRVRSGVADVIATPAGGRDSLGHIEADGSLVYSDAFDGCDVRYCCEALKTEEFIVVREPATAQSRMRWSWDLNTGSLTPHLTPAFTIELWDAAGVPRLRINAPEGKDAAGKPLRINEGLSLTLQGSRVTLSADLSGCKFPVTIDPTWSSTGALATARYSHTATVLNSGKVLVAGGYGPGSTFLNSCELFDPATGTWGSTGLLNTARSNHTATLLGGGKVLVAGGNLNSFTIGQAELYDPALGTWSTTGSLTTSRYLHTATLLGNGKVLVAGGYFSNPPSNNALSSCELYDPSVGTWATTGAMSTTRLYHTATLLGNGQVLAAGGDSNGGGGVLNSSELYNSASGTWSVTTGALGTARSAHTATLLANGKVLVAGGYNGGGVNSCELYDPVAGKWSATGALAKFRYYYTATLLANGKVLAAGGTSTMTNSCELYDPVAGTWSGTVSLGTGRAYHTASVLGNGTVLVAGGFASSALNQCEIFNAKPAVLPQTVSVNTGSSVQITPQSDSIDTASVSFAIVSGPSHGIISGSSPTFTYTPNGTFAGTDTFTVHATDTFGTGSPATITVNVNEITITSISPDATTVGTPITMTVNGSNFVASSIAQFNGSNLTTSFVSPTQLTAVIPVSDLGTPGQFSISVLNPVQGGVSQQNAVFFVYSGATVGTWIVTNTRDDTNPGSLRFAMMNCRKGDSILFDPNVFDLTNADLATVINILTPLPLLDKGSVTIDAQNQRVTINGSNAGSTGFTMTSDANKIFGLSILAFTGSGVAISGGKNNTIGGDRTLGSGVNGQGIRIAKCGAAGIELTNGACNNSIMGCWIGLDSSGSAAEPNLGGILIHNQSCTNVIGGSTPGQANVISGNEFEGITISDTGTNNNVVQGNIIGATAVTVSSRDATARSSGLLSLGTRTGLGNGGAGIFLSRGTQGSVVGAAAGDPDTVLPARSNVLAFNGGNGIEIRANVSKQNASRGNLISNNIRGGITLFDGSNSGINPPLLTSFTLGTRTGAGGTVQIQGTATNGDGSPGNGMIEIFSDPGNQGQNLLVRTPVTNGTWSAQATLSDLTMNVNGTYTDTNGNTSAFGNFGTPSGAAPAASSSTAVLDQLAGIDPSNPATAPVSTGTASATKFTVGLNFAKSNHDSLQTSIQLMSLPSNFTFDKTSVAFAVNEVGQKLPLDAKGKAALNGTTLKLLKLKSGSTGTLQLSIRNQALAMKLADAGLTSQATTAKSGVQVTIPIGVALITSAGTYVYQGSVTAMYKATQGKSGKAKKQ